MNQPPDINQYRPPKRHGGWIAVIIVTALVVALVIVAPGGGRAHRKRGRRVAIKVSGDHAAAVPATLGAFVRERAETLGDQVACYWFQDDRSLSFRDLDEQADKLASAFGPLGVRKGSHVAVMLSNRPETMITWTAIGRLGAVMVPINTRYTATELAFVLNDSDAQYLVIEESYLSAIRHSGFRRNPPSQPTRSSRARDRPSVGAGF